MTYIVEHDTIGDVVKEQFIRHHSNTIITGVPLSNGQDELIIAKYSILSSIPCNNTSHRPTASTQLVRSSELA